MGNIFVHIGLPKTGTTFLQSQVFPEICKDEWFLFNPPIFNKLRLMKSFNSNEEISAFYKAFPNKNHIEYKKSIDAFLTRYNDSVICLSDEDFSGSGYGMYYEETLKILAYYLPGAKIILFVRNHVDWIISLYKQSIQQGNFQSFDEFIYYSDDRKECFNTYQNGILPKLNLKKINYNGLINSLETKFSKENINIFHYEDFKKDNDKVIGQLFDTIRGNRKSSRINGKIIENKIIYRNLSGLSIIIVLFIYNLMKPFKDKIYYNQNIKLYYNNNPVIKPGLFFNIINWVRLRTFLINYLDRFSYMDQFFIDHLKSKLEPYEDYFIKDIIPCTKQAYNKSH